jgi:glycosyltransferase involved in cell wall biosynthesis
VEREEVSKPTVAVAIPAYNEADGIGGFLQEVEDALTPHVAALRLVVVDDSSTDGTSDVLEELRPKLQGTLEVLCNETNRGHGPSLMNAYRRALESEPDFVLQVDGDGQFQGSDLRRVLVLLVDEAHAACGVRRFRQDPWFRMVMTRMVRAYVQMSFDVRARDPNCPLRGYESRLLRDLLATLPQDCLVPNLFLTILAARRGVALVEVDVSHRVRRGATSEGTTWRRGAHSPIPWRLVRFSIAALRESRSFRARLGTPAPPGEAALRDAA